jgi:hypothetical protein
MHEQGIPDGLLREDEVDRALLFLLVNDEAALPWSVEELAREIGGAVVVQDSLARLYGAGLVHRLGGFAFATRAALRAAELAG